MCEDPLQVRDRGVKGGCTLAEFPPVPPANLSVLPIASWFNFFFHDTKQIRIIGSNRIRVVERHDAVAEPLPSFVFISCSPTFSDIIAM